MWYTCFRNTSRILLGYLRKVFWDLCCSFTLSIFFAFLVCMLMIHRLIPIISKLWLPKIADVAFLPGSSYEHMHNASFFHGKDIHINSVYLSKLRFCCATLLFNFSDGVFCWCEKNRKAQSREDLYFSKISCRSNFVLENPEANVFLKKNTIYQIDVFCSHLMFVSRK